MNGILILKDGKMTNGDGYDIDEMLKVENEILLFIGGKEMIDNPNDETVRRTELKGIMEFFLLKYEKKMIISALRDLEATGKLCLGE
jgi:hypothetical protein